MLDTTAHVDFERAPSASPAPRGTKLRILRAAERLFAERGVDRVSLAEITKEAGQRNRSAIHYHFGSKKEVVHAISMRHSLPIQTAWLEPLSQMEADGTVTLEKLLELLVRPIVAKLDDPDGGEHYVHITAELVASRSFPLLENPAANAEGAMKLSMMMIPFTKADPSLVPLRMSRLAATLYRSVSDYANLSAIAGAPVVSREVFINDLIDCMRALVDAPPSPATTAALSQSA